MSELYTTHGTVRRRDTVFTLRKDTVTTVTTDTMEMVIIMVTTVMETRDTAREKNENYQTFNKSDFLDFSDSKKQNLRESKPADESKAPVAFEKGAALMLQGERELFGNLPI